MNQPDLFEQTQTLTEIDRGHLVWLEAFLLTRTDWATAHAIQQSSDGRLSDRAIRALASASGGAIISGQRGYKHLDKSTPEEVMHSIAWLQSQGKTMINRATAQYRRFHQSIHP